MLRALVLLAVPQSASPEATLEPHGSFVLRYGGVPVLTGDSLLLMDEKWKGIDRIAAGDLTLTRDGDVVSARGQTAITTLTKTVVSRADHVEARWDIEMKPDPRGRHVELCIAIEAPVLAELDPKGKSHNVLESDRELRFESMLGGFTFDVRGSTHPWSLDDMRRHEWAKRLRLRFAPPYDPAKGCKATAILRVRVTPSTHPAFATLDVKSAANRGLSGDVDGDGKGGWTDQGANDLRVFVPGRHQFMGVPFDVGPKVVVLRGKERPAFPAQAAPIAVGRRLARVYFLHTAAWSAEWRQPIATYEITYLDDKTLSVPVRYGVDVNDWWGAAEPLEARVAWQRNNGHTQVGIFTMRWINPRPDVSVKSVTMRSTNSGAVPVLLAATGIAAGGLTGEQLVLLDRAFAERGEVEVSTEGWFPAPIAWNDGIEPGTALDVSFMNEGPAGQHGFLRVRDGHFVFERGDGKPVRFWATNAALHGPYPEKSQAPGIARCLARQGVNMVRMHLYAVYEDTIIAPDGSLNPAALDKFEFFIAELKKEGIYTYMDLNDGMFYDRLLGKKIDASMKKLKKASLFNRELIAAQKKLARMLFTHVNACTGLRMCDDPAVALYEITNENSMTANWGSLKSRLPEPYLTELDGLWKAWLERNGKPERPLAGALAGDTDSRRFGAELQRKYLEEMYAHLREIGVKAPICGTNITFALGELWASQGMDYTNDHAYWDHGNLRVKPPVFRNKPTVRYAAHSMAMMPRFARASPWWRANGTTSTPTTAAARACRPWPRTRRIRIGTGSFSTARPVRSTAGVGRTSRARPASSCTRNRPTQRRGGCRRSPRSCIAGATCCPADAS